MKSAGAQIQEAAMLAPPLIQPMSRLAKRKSAFDSAIFCDFK